MNAACTEGRMLVDVVPFSPTVETEESPRRPDAGDPGQPWAELRSYLQTVLGAVVLAIIIMTFVARAFTVDGPSMQPTLYSGEKLIVDRLSYRLHTPMAGDLVVCRFPAEPTLFYIKRLVGVPGDVVEIAEGTVNVNGVPLHEDNTAEPVLGAFGPCVVPPDHYFVLGDNRNNSEDSRSIRVGFVPANSIIGRALWRYWPLSRAGRLAGNLSY